MSRSGGTPATRSAAALAGAAGGGDPTVWGGAGDTVQGALGTGSATVSFSSSGGAETLWDNGATSSGQDTVFNFTHSRGDIVSVTSGENIGTVLASSHDV